MKIFGAKSILLIALGFIGLAVFSANSHYSIEKSLLTLALLYIVLCFFFLKIIVVTSDRIKILSIVNPFLKKIDLKIIDIDQFLINTNTFVGLTTIQIQTKKNSIKRTGYLLQWEQNKLTKTLEEYNINVENFRM